MSPTKIGSGKRNGQYLKPENRNSPWVRVMLQQASEDQSPLGMFSYLTLVRSISGGKYLACLNLEFQMEKCEFYKSKNVPQDR